MVFSALSFLFYFLPLVLVLHLVLRDSLRNLILLAASLFFYAWGEGALVLLMVGSILFNYGVGLTMHRVPGSRKWILAIGVGGNLALLASFKYAQFFLENIWALLTLNNNASGEIVDIPLPIGISFFTFQAISYLVDLYRGKHPVQRNLLDLALYISFFPQLIAGPIVRYQEIYQQIRQRSLSVFTYASGAQRFLIGLVKKVLIADTLASVVDPIFAVDPVNLPVDLAWFGVFAYALQIYFDFSGYSDMAIGLGQLFGFRLPENFRYPYMSQSIREFWRRWHITLSTWFRDYLYIPLGGSRRGLRRTYLNLILVFFLCGLWHGASWHFVVWGLFHGIFLILERIQGGHWLSRLPAMLRHAYALLVVGISWVFFRAEDMGQAVAYLWSMLGGGSGNGFVQTGVLLDQEVWVISLLGVLFSFPVYLGWQRWISRQSPRLQMLALGITQLLLLGLGAYAILSLARGAYSPFIYFRF